MRLEQVLRLEGQVGASGLFYATGSFGIVNHAVACEHTREGNREVFRYRQGDVLLTATFTQEKQGVVIRKDSFKNLSDSPMEINALSSRFGLDGCAYEVYTQYNSWQHESDGGWQPLTTQVMAAGQGIRTCDGAVPMMALHNLHNGQITVFHLMPNAQWQMNALKYHHSKKQAVVVETGFHRDNMRLTVAPGEEIFLPVIIFFAAKNKVDLDAYKLHEVFNALYPRKTLPVVFNSWLYCFDNLDIEGLFKQVDCAAELGVEAFMIDAGWFGDGKHWSSAVGDWIENTTGGPKGRLIEISRRVREKGMTFGLWFEPERATPESNAVKAHPDYYIDETFLNFANPDAVNYMADVLSEQIEKYQIGWLKFDFNESIPLDPSGDVFYRYLQGQKRFVEILRSRYPDLYITNCAGGGYRMELGQAAMFDSFWFTDNQGPYDGIRIVKDTLKRMPTALIERWNVQKYCEGFPKYGVEEPVGVMLSCNNATWDFILNVDDSFTKAFINGGPIGFSCDLASMPDSYKELWKEQIAAFKKNREFFMNATARILVDSEDIVVIQYADPGLNRCMVQLFTKRSYASCLTVYPVVDCLGEYCVDGEKRSGQDICDNGILFKDLQDNCCYTAELKKEMA